MTTSLAAQLKRLRTPQTNLLLQDKKRDSLLFDPKDAANLDRDTVLSIGQSGLQELVKLSVLFEEFNTTLFAESSLNLERAVQDATVNKKLDKAIEKFLVLSSPYFLLSATHKALEWLIHRYYIHQYNRDKFILLILPYHETRMFVRALQLIDLSDESSKWHWLARLQKHGVPLASKTLVNRLSTDNGLLKMVYKHVMRATEIYSNQAFCLTTLYAFYTTTTLGVIEQSSTITEVQINYLLPTLLHGLKSSIADFAASSYMIVAKLTTKVKFNANTMEKLLLKTFKENCLKQEAILFLIYLYQAPINRLTAMIPQSLILQLSNLSWFVEAVANIHLSNTNISKFLVYLLQSACHIVVEDPENTNNVQNMITDILTRIKFSDDTVDIILPSVLTCEFFTNEKYKNAKDFLVTFCQSFERSYPESFDKYLRKLMKHSENSKDSKQMLHFLMFWVFDTKDTQDSVIMLDKLNHINAEQRVFALKTLAATDMNISESFQEMFTNTLQARFCDDEVTVIETLLSLSTKKLTSLIPTDTLIDNLLLLLTTCHTEFRKILVKPALKILLELCNDGDNTNVFIASLPYLFPRVDNDVEIAMEVLRSNFAKSNKYMQHVMTDISSSDVVNAEVITVAAFHNVLNYELLPATENILDSVKQQISHGDATSLFFNMILLGSVCRVSVGSIPAETARQVIEIAMEIIKKYPNVEVLHNCNNITGSNIQMALKLTSQGILPLQVGTYVLEMVHRRLNLKSESRLDFDESPARSNLILRLLEMFFEGMNKKRWRNHYSRCLQIFFQRHFNTNSVDPKDLIRFLSQFFMEPVKQQTSYHCLQITLFLLNHCSSIQWATQDPEFVINLLLSLARRNSMCRAVSLKILNTLTQTFNLDSEPFLALLQELTARSIEISQDPEQVSLSFYMLLSPDPDVSRHLKQRRKLQQAQKLLFDAVMNEDFPMQRRSQLLELLTYVNGTEILQQLVPLGLRLLWQISQGGNQSTNNALKNVLQRFDCNTVNVLDNEIIWSLFTNSIMEHEICIVTESGEQLSPSIILLRQINETFFENAGKVSNAFQAKIFAKILDVISDCEISNVISNAGRAIRRIRIDAVILKSELEAMRFCGKVYSKSDNMMKKKRQSQICQLLNPAMVHNKLWKRGIVVLEFMQTADNIEHEELLYGILFDLLNICLSLEEQSPVEYTNQLLLSTIHRLITKKLPVRDPNQQVVLITKCIRTSRNPQTHHHALLVLVELLKNIDVRQALFNIMPIFTFMGNTVVRQDDAYSIQIISKILETVVPIVNATDNEIHACELLRIFVVSLPDIPEHRRIPLFIKLLQLLDNHLHLYYLLTFERHILTNMKITNQKTPAQRLDFALQVSQTFSPQRLLQVCVKIADFIKELPIDIEEKEGKETAMKFPHKHVYDVTTTTPKNLRQYKMTAMQFLNNLLSSQDFINRIAELSQDETNEVSKYCDYMMIELIILIEDTSKTADQHLNKPSARYWKVLLHHLYDVLDLINNLLPNEMFLKNIKNLLKHKLLYVRKKALELFNTRLIQKKFGEQNPVDLLDLIKTLVSFINDDIKTESQEEEIIQQTVLISLKLLAKLLANNHPDVFKPILEMTTELLRSKDGPVLASAALCVAELCSSMRTHALYSLNNFVPAILKLLKTYCHQNIPDVIAISIVTALQKIVESVGVFLSLYLEQLLFELTRLSSLYTDNEHPKISLVASRLKATTQKLFSCISLRVLLPAINKTYRTLLTKKLYQYLPALLRMLAESFNNVQPEDLNIAISDLTSFFLEILQFREHIEASENAMDTDDAEITLKEIIVIEENASKALIVLVLKLSETTFNPLYCKLYDWMVKNPQCKQRTITFYRLSANIAECLKSLFVLFAGKFLVHAASLLSNNNTFVNETPQALTLPEESSRIELVEAILLTVHRVFSYDAHNFVNQERFETLAQPIVDQLENTMGTVEEYENRANTLIVPCIASFASAIPDDSLHKQLVYQTLLKTRHAKPYVRSAALNALVGIARKLGEDFMPLLPDVVPFLAELLEDEDEATEKCAQNAVRTLEEILGEPLQKYF